ncbi:MAG: hypothetical protein JXJ04_26740 [Spirochaetales bacterium]|nr:hypothetical protein [Spirochaetales bacterium]
MICFKSITKNPITPILVKTSILFDGSPAQRGMIDRITADNQKTWILFLLINGNNTIAITINPERANRAREICPAGEEIISRSAMGRKKLLKRSMGKRIPIALTKHRYGPTLSVTGRKSWNKTCNFSL